MPLDTMKKLLLILSIFVVTFSAFAADLNPFAYGLKSSVNAINPMRLDIEYKLNAPATSVKVYLYDVDKTWEQEVTVQELLPKELDDHRTAYSYTGWIDLSVIPGHLRGGENNILWRVDVKGAAVASPTFVKNDVRLFAPTSVDIDNNPENANFGTVFCVEGLNGAHKKSGYTSYISYRDGAGLYVLNADGSDRKMPYQEPDANGYFRYGYNGGVVNKDISGKDDETRPSFGGTSGYNAYRVRVSDDGRIFVTCLSTNGHVLWEAKKEVFSATTKEEWSANTGWHKIMVAGNANTVMATEKRNCSHSYCGIYSLFQGDASTGAFIAGPNVGFDLRGSGDNLKLLMLAGCQQAIAHFTPAHFYCDEYDFKSTTTLWNTAPSRRVFAGHTNAVNIINAQGAQVQYDKNGNVWMCQHRGGTDASTLLRVNGTTGAIDYEETKTPYRRCGAVRFNNDFTQFIVASNENPGTGDKQGGGFTVYPVDASTGMPIWNQGTHVNTTSETGVSLMDFAWDYAGNLYIAADNATNGERIAVYAMPHAADRVVSTPAASRYAFTVSCQAGKQCTVNTVCYPEEGGTIVCSVEGNARTGVLTLESCTELTVTATPEDGYKFLNWTDGNGNVLSSNKEFTFYVTEDIITLKANFEYATYTGIVWKNLFLNGEDIADKESDTYAGVNERLWRLFQVWWNDEFSASRNDQGTTSGKNEYDVAGFVTSANAVKMFTEPNRPFRWLGKYMMSVVGDTITNGTYWGIANINIWGYYLYAFINRTDKVYNSQNQAMGNDSKVHFEGFPSAGQPSKWRPYWAEEVCKLPRTMKYSDFMPTISTWKRDFQCPSGWNVPSVTPNVIPSSWYKWNHPHTDGFPEDQKDVDYKKYFILAWRKGSPTAEEIVHHVYESNMELHASYVLKNIDEEDRVDVSKYDASNDDVFQLMLNRRWVDLNPDPAVIPTHSLTITRKLQAGMYNTICLPFSVDLTGLADNKDYTHPLKDADAYEFAGTTTSTYNESGEPVTILNFNKVTQLQAGVPYLIKLKEGNKDITDEDVLPFTGVACDTTLRPSVGGGLIFQPTINPTTVPAGSLILVANNRLAQTTSDGKMNGMRGYFMIDPNDPLLADDIAEQAKDGRVYLSFQKPTTTSIPVAPEAEQAVQPKVRKVMYDGQIYILRGEEVYTITGNRVK